MTNDKALAKIAARVLKSLEPFDDDECFALWGEREYVQVAPIKSLLYPEERMFTVAELRMLAASVPGLNQELNADLRLLRKLRGVCRLSHLDAINHRIKSLEISKGKSREIVKKARKSNG